MNRLTLMHTQSAIRHFSSLANQSTTNSLSITHSETGKSIAAPSFTPSTASHTSSKLDRMNELALKPSSNSVSSIYDSAATKNTQSTDAAGHPIQAKNNECLMLLTISADCVAELRHLVMRTCGEWIVFIRTQPIAHATKIKVWLCMSNPASDMVMDAVMRALPSAEFGQITHG